MATNSIWNRGHFCLVNSKSRAALPLELALQIGRCRLKPVACPLPRTGRRGRRGRHNLAGNHRYGPGGNRHRLEFWRGRVTRAFDGCGHRQGFRGVPFYRISIRRIPVIGIRVDRPSLANLTGLFTPPTVKRFVSRGAAADRHQGDRAAQHHRGSVSSLHDHDSGFLRVNSRVNAMGSRPETPLKRRRSRVVHP